MESYKAKNLPLTEEMLNPSTYNEELIDAVATLEVYKSNLKNSKLNQHWFLPTLQQIEALASSKLEGTQATIDGVLVNQIVPNGKSKDLTEVSNYNSAALWGYTHLSENPFSLEFFKDIHEILMSGNIRRNQETMPGKLRTKQNYIGKVNSINSVTYVPPAPEHLTGLMQNLITYMNEPSDKLRPLVRTAIAHAQFETIHPFMDGNGRVGRILIPLYLYKQGQLELPCFFISELLERNKFRYYELLNQTRLPNNWNSWIKFFLQTVIIQCKKYIELIDQINKLYETDLAKAKSRVSNNKIVDVINVLYKYPVINASSLTEATKLPPATATRYLAALTEAEILYTDGKARNRTFFYYDLINLIH